MIATMEISAGMRAAIRRNAERAERADQAMAEGLRAGVIVGAEDIREQLIMGRLGLRMQNPAAGLAASVAAGMLDETRLIAWIGVPGNSPAAAYAQIQAEGGTILPKNGKALSIPISAEAKKWGGPRQMEAEGGVELDLIPRPGKPPLLVEKLSRRGNVVGFTLHWVLVPSVTLEATDWLAKGVSNASALMAEAFSDQFFSIFVGEG